MTGPKSSLSMTVARADTGGGRHVVLMWQGAAGLRHDMASLRLALSEDQYDRLMNFAASEPSAECGLKELPPGVLADTPGGGAFWWLAEVIKSLTPVPAAPPLCIGEVVRLRSGGPRMTVTHLRDGTADVAWFDPAGHAEPVEVSLPVACLDRVPAKE